MQAMCRKVMRFAERKMCKSDSCSSLNWSSSASSIHKRLGSISKENTTGAELGRVHSASKMFDTNKKVDETQSECYDLHDSVPKSEINFDADNWKSQSFPNLAYNTTKMEKGKRACAGQSGCTPQSKLKPKSKKKRKTKKKEKEICKKLEKEICKKLENENAEPLKCIGFKNSLKRSLSERLDKFFANIDPKLLAHYGRRDSMPNNTLGGEEEQEFISDLERREMRNEEWKESLDINYAADANRRVEEWLENDIFKPLDSPPRCPACNKCANLSHWQIKLLKLDYKDYCHCARNRALPKSSASFQLERDWNKLQRSCNNEIRKCKESKRDKASWLRVESGFCGQDTETFLTPRHLRRSFKMKPDYKCNADLCLQDVVQVKGFQNVLPQKKCVALEEYMPAGETGADGDGGTARSRGYGTDLQNNDRIYVSGFKPQKVKLKKIQSTTVDVVASEVEKGQKQKVQSLLSMNSCGHKMDSSLVADNNSLAISISTIELQTDIEKLSGKQRNRSYAVNAGTYQPSTRTTQSSVAPPKPRSLKNRFKNIFFSEE